MSNIVIKITDNIYEAMKEGTDFEIDGNIYNIFELQIEDEYYSTITIKFVRD